MSLDEDIARIRARSSDAASSRARVGVDENALHALGDRMRMAKCIGSAHGVDSPFASSRLEAPRAAALAILFGVINYRFFVPGERKPYLYKSGEASYLRSAGVVRALIEAEVDWSDLEAVLSISLSSWRALLQVSPTNALFETDIRLDRVQLCADYLLRRGVDFRQSWIESVSPQAAYELLRESGLFEDPFLKRLQRALADLGAVARRCASCAFYSPALTALPDYRLPQLLEAEGVFVLHPSDRSLLDACVELDEDDPFVDAMRAATVAACALLARQLGSSDLAVDQCLWERAQLRLRSGAPMRPPMNVRTRRF